jgi:hypothetical protein
MGGDLTVTGVRGQGSTFTVLLPAMVPKPTWAIPARSVRGADEPHPVMLVSDRALALAARHFALEELEPMAREYRPLPEGAS